MNCCNKLKWCEIYSICSVMQFSTNTNSTNLWLLGILNVSHQSPYINLWKIVTYSFKIFKHLSLWNNYIFWHLQCSKKIKCMLPSLFLYKICYHFAIIKQEIIVIASIFGLLIFILTKFCCSTSSFVNTSNSSQLCISSSTCAIMWKKFMKSCSGKF